MEKEKEDPYGGSTDEGSDMDTHDVPGNAVIALYMYICLLSNQLI